jgi:hypothetical protein
MTVISKNVGHQFPRVACVDMDYSELPATATWTGVFDLPGGAIPIGGAMHVVTAFNPGSALTAAFGTSGTPGKYLAATSLAAAARTAAITQNVALAASEHVGVTLALTGAVPTAGRVIFWLEYLLPDSQHETVG